MSNENTSPNDPAGSETGGRTETGGGHFSTEPVVVWEAENMMEAEIVRGRLVSEGIPAIIRGEALGQIYGLTMGGLAAAAVLVPAPLADKAIEILSIDPSEYADGSDADEDESSAQSDDGERQD